VLGAYFVLYPNSTVRGLVVIFPVQLSAWFFLGAWFLYQLIEANFGIFGSAANGGGVAFFAHVGRFVFGAIIAWLLTGAGLVAPPGPQRRAARPGLAPPLPLHDLVIDEIENGVAKRGSDPEHDHDVGHLAGAGQPGQEED
jgi:hypothetical protein